MKSKYLILILLCAVLACKKKTGHLPDAEISSKEAWFEVPEDAAETDGVEMHAADFQWLAFKSRLSYLSEVASFENASLTLRIQKDSVIWFSATHLGFEVARAMFDRDSLRMLNRFQKEYVVSDYRQLSNKLGVWLTYPHLQALLTGDPVYPADKDRNWFYKSDSSDFFIQSDLFLKINTEVLRVSGRPLRTIVEDSRSGNLLKVINSGFSRVGNALIPGHIMIEMRGISTPGNEKKGTSILLNHQKIDTLEAAPGFPFTVPSNYKRIVL